MTDPTETAALIRARAGDEPVALGLILPILTFIDTPGAYPGIGAEERGQSEGHRVL